MFVIALAGSKLVLSAGSPVVLFSQLDEEGTQINRAQHCRKLPGTFTLNPNKYLSSALFLFLFSSSSTTFSSLSSLHFCFFTSLVWTCLIAVVLSVILYSSSSTSTLQTSHISFSTYLDHASIGRLCQHCPSSPQFSARCGR